MLTIYAHQLEQLNDHFQSRLVESIRVHLRKHFPDECAQRIASDADSIFIRRSLEAARPFRLTTNENLTIFTDFRLIFGYDFPMNTPWAIVILTDASLTETEKIDRLVAYLDQFDHTLAE